MSTLAGCSHHWQHPRRYYNLQPTCGAAAATHLRQALPLLPQQADEGEAQGQSLARWQAGIAHKLGGPRDQLAAQHLRV